MNAATETGGITVSVTDGIGRLILDRPSHKNSLTKAMCLELTEAVTRLDADPDVAVITLQGADGNFCAGAGLDQFDQVLFDGADDGSAGPGTDRLSEADAAIRATRKPTVALVEGICMGGGWQIAAAADVVVASTTARIAVTPSKLGIVYPRAGLERLADRVGMDRAKYLLLTASEVTPTQAEQWGLVTVLFEAETFAAQAAGVVSTIRSRSLFSNVSHKRLLDGYAERGSGVDISEDARHAYEADWTRTWEDFRTGPDLAEGRRAFAAKERPAFPWTLPEDQAVHL
ncbi:MULTISPECIES: enoyl-CoA hydratase/isomerase family protein [Citricoccus]|uniref:enoyl-CoA hydratase/isomerase family protein n=1 Tax=Citricoccus TaxID=169133 RepID=UPI000255F656|nr:enoyl-CoA hydratase/isomerase family protein [Citricoccus sp. CH26A]